MDSDLMKRMQKYLPIYHSDLCNRELFINAAEIRKLAKIEAGIEYDGNANMHRQISRVDEDHFGNIEIIFNQYQTCRCPAQSVGRRWRSEINHSFVDNVREYHDRLHAHCA
jgi:hypothetical protein